MDSCLHLDCDVSESLEKHQQTQGNLRIRELVSRADKIESGL